MEISAILNSVAIGAMYGAVAVVILGVGFWLAERKAEKKLKKSFDEIHSGLDEMTKKLDEWNEELKTDNKRMDKELERERETYKNQYTV